MSANAEHLRLGKRSKAKPQQLIENHVAGAHPILQT
jgi:hypothetical protein